MEALGAIFSKLDVRDYVMKSTSKGNNNNSTTERISRETVVNVHWQSLETK